MWNSRTRAKGYRTSVLLDTGAGGGNYASLKFIRAVECTEYRGRNTISKRGRGFLRAANPTGSEVAPMKIIGTSLLPLVLPPVDRVFRARVRVVEDLPVGLILGAAFMRRYNSVLFFEGGGWFKPTRDSARVPMLDPKPRPTPRPWREDLNVLQGPEG